MSLQTPQATPSTPGRSSRQRNTQTVRAPYGPSCIREWVQQQDIQPLNVDIAAERQRRRFGIRNDRQEFPASAGHNFLHPHFCPNVEDRLWAWHEGMSDVQDSITGMARLADVVHIGFAVRAEWNPTLPITLDSIEIVPTVTRQIEQMNGWSAVVEKMEAIFRREIALPHILQYATKLGQIRPPPGNTLDEATRDLMIHPLQIDPNLQRNTFASSPSISTRPPSIPIPTPSASTLATPTPISSAPPRSLSTRTARERSGEPATIARPLRQAAAPSSSRARGDGSHRPSTSRTSVSTPIATPSRQPLASSGRVLPSSGSRVESSRIQRSQAPAAGTTRQTHSSRPEAVYGEEIISISSDEEDVSEYITQPRLHRPRTSRPQRRSSHWIHTPAGSPSRGPTASDIPPSYYTDPALASFGFPPAVMQFLQENNHTNARALCIINATQNCEIDCWLPRFCEAGLSTEEATRLKELLFEALPHEWRIALTAPPGSPTPSIGTSESSLSASEAVLTDEDSYWRGLETDPQDSYWEPIAAVAT
ncbi:hypothetical protein HWV62_1174 [Athelia sp. TMB]|nr:hypothetical protein HWV62_1174 [Athelia sp. TMB]